MPVPAPLSSSTPRTILLPLPPSTPPFSIPLFSPPPFSLPHPPPAFLLLLFLFLFLFLPSFTLWFQAFWVEEWALKKDLVHRNHLQIQMGHIVKIFKCICVLDRRGGKADSWELCKGFFNFFPTSQRSWQHSIPKYRFRVDLREISCMCLDEKKSTGVAIKDQVSCFVLDYDESRIIFVNFLNLLYFFIYYAHTPYDPLLHENVIFVSTVFCVWRIAYHSITQVYLIVCCFHTLNCIILCDKLRNMCF